MKPGNRIFAVLLILFSLAGYLEWGGGNQSFLLQAEADIVLKLFCAPSEVAHPLTILPLFGQILLLWAIFSQRNHRKLIITGGALISILMILILFIGCISSNFKMIVSTIPFLTVYLYMLLKNKYS